MGELGSVTDLQTFRNYIRKDFLSAHYKVFLINSKTDIFADRKRAEEIK